MGRFSKERSLYKQNLDLVAVYRKEMIKGLLLATSVDEVTAANIIDDVITAANVETVKAKMSRKTPDEGREIHTVGVLDFLNGLMKSDFMVSPSLTTYFPRSKRVSLIAGELDNGLARRRVVKRQAQIDAIKGNITAATIGKGLQNAIKIYVNSWSGAGQSPFNPYYCKSTHPTLSLMCRISTAMATSLIERCLAGKRYYYSPQRVIDDIIQTVLKVKREAVVLAKSLYNLHVPTIEECLTMIKRSTKYYFWGENDLDVVRTLVGNLDDIERMALMYSLDFYHLFLYNDNLIHGKIETITNIDIKTLPVSKVTLEDNNIGKVIGKDERDLLATLIGDEIAGEVLEDIIEEGDKGLQDKILRMGANITHVMNSLTELIDAFFITDILPIALGKQDDAIRLTVPLGDTDSSVYTTKHINKLYFGENSFCKSHSGVTAFAIYLMNGVIEHGLGVFTGQMNIDNDYRHRLVMKNEFGIPTLMLTSVAKTYAGFVKSEEGLVYPKPKFEIKGQRMHGGKISIPAKDRIQNWVKDNLVKLTEGEMIDRGELVDMILGYEEEVYASMDDKNNPFYTRLNIKPLEAYSKPKSQDYAKIVFWNEVFGDKYGKVESSGEYKAYKVSLIFNKGITDWLNTLTESQRAGYKRYLDFIGKDYKHQPTFIAIPIEVFRRIATPDEIKPIVNTYKVTKATTDIHYLLLGSLGLNFGYSDANLTLSDLFEDN